MPLLAALIACVAACAPATRSAPVGVVSPPLRVGTSGDYPPFSVRTRDGGFDGFDVAVARAYGRDRGRAVELVPFAWPDLERRLVGGDFDVAMSGVTVRGDRIAIAPMTAAVARTSAVVVVPAARVAAVPANGAGATLAVNRGGHLERVARARLSGATLRVVDDNRSLPHLLAAGTVDGVVTDTLEAATFASADGVPTRIALVLSEDRKAYWVAPGDDALADDLDAWLAARAADGTLDALRRQHLGAAGAPEAGPLAPTAVVADLVARRLQLMPEVASAKAAAGLPVEVPAREAELIERARAAARCAGLVPEPYVALVRAQMEVAKLVQRAVLGARGAGQPPQDGDEEVTAKARLDGRLRPAIDRLDRQIREALVAHAPLQGSAARLAGALQADAPVPGLDPGEARRLAEALLAVPAAGAGRCADSA